MTGARVIDGRYRLAEKIGHGGMGQVWAGYDERLDRRVAVKLLRTDLLLAAEAASAAGADPREGREDLRRRFLRECRITAAMDHPGLVTVFDAGRGCRRALPGHAAGPRGQPRRPDRRGEPVPDRVGGRGGRPDLRRALVCTPSRWSTGT